MRYFAPRGYHDSPTPSSTPVHSTDNGGSILEWLPFKEEDGTEKPAKTETPPLSPIWVKPWLKRRDEKGAYNNILSEIRLDDAESYRRYLRMNTETFEVSGVF